jgi:hypothetical protein
MRKFITIILLLCTLSLSAQNDDSKTGKNDVTKTEQLSQNKTNSNPLQEAPWYLTVLGTLGTILGLRELISAYQKSSIRNKEKKTDLEISTVQANIAMNKDFQDQIVNKMFDNYVRINSNLMDLYKELQPVIMDNNTILKNTADDIKLTHTQRQKDLDLLLDRIDSMSQKSTVDHKEIKNRLTTLQDKVDTIV